MSAPTVLVVDLDGERHELAWPEGKLLVEVMEEAGLDVPYSCREGHCGACTTEVVEGEVALRANDTLDDDDLADGLVRACQAEARSPRVHVTYD